MFSGIVESVGSVVAVRDSKAGRDVTIQTPAKWKLREGESICVEGVCSTVQRCAGLKAYATFVYMNETLRRTTLGSLRQGDGVNLERSLRLNSLVGGHLVQGHVDATARIRSIRADGDARVYAFSLPPRYSRYLVEKGSIAVDGISLTVVEATPRWFNVSLLAYTLSHTTLGKKRVGDRVNIEVDMVAKYVERLLH